MANLLFPVLNILSDGKFHSGEAIAKHFNVSRVSIWQAIAEAEKLGYKQIIISKYNKFTPKEFKIEIVQFGKIEEVFKLLF